MRKSTPLATAAFGLLVASSAAAAPIKVAVIGPQHVHSHQLTYAKEFPAMLQVLLGPEYEVGNFGDCCASVLRGYPRQKETHPYLESGESYPQVGGMNFKDSLKFMPDVVLIAPFGKHDRELAMQLYGGKLDRAKLEADYEALVTTYLDLPQKPKVYVSTPIPIPYGSPASVVTEVMLPAVQAVIDKHKLPSVDFHAMFLNHKELFKDDTHVTNDTGLRLLASGFHALMKNTVTADAGVAPDAAPAADAGSAPVPDAASTGGAGGAAGSMGTGGAAGNMGTGGKPAPDARGEDPVDEPDPAGGAAPRKSGCAIGGGHPGSILVVVVLLLGRLPRRRRPGS
jgi:hypothetical protein